MTDKTKIEKLLLGAENMEWACREVGKKAAADFIAELVGTLKQQKVALQLAEQALKVESESLADVIKMVTDKDSEVPNVWTNRLKKVQAALTAIKAAKEFKSYQPPDLSQDQE